MSDMNVNQVLAQMRVMAAKAQNPVQAPTQVPTDAGSSQGVEFSNVLKNSINAVNDVQKASGALKKRFDMGDTNVSMVDIAIAGEKSKVAFTAMTQVRNKVVQAYKDVMSMSI